MKSARWRTYALIEHEELYEHWHNRPLALAQRAPEYLFARFAWDIFPGLQGFLHSGPPRRLAVYNPESDKHEIRMYKQAERRVFTMGEGRGRSASPTKRQRSTQSTDHADWVPVCSESRRRSGSNGSNRSALHGEGDSSRNSLSHDSAIGLAKSSRYDGELEDQIVGPDCLVQNISTHFTGRHKRPRRSPDFRHSHEVEEFERRENDRGRKRCRS